MEKENITIRYVKQEELKQVNNLRKEVHELHFNRRGISIILKNLAWIKNIDAVELLRG